SPRTWPRVALVITAIVGVVLGAAALVVALTRPTVRESATPNTNPSPFTPAETASAHRKLCDIYRLAARQVQIEINGDNPALASAAGVNAAVMLEHAVGQAPELAPSDHEAALALAEAYTSTNAMGSYLQFNDPALQAAISDVNVKDSRMKALCSGG
ncbi:hypothetical protein, partial [Mycobacterium marinum]|uniref:hypothetical protein n=1 Tax=Mycobacterium marinum TaxID=1781 RepID=UPI0035614502